MSRPIDADGTFRYSTGRPGRENAFAGAASPTTPINPGRSAASMAATAIRRVNAPRNFSLIPRNFMVLYPSHLSYAAPHAIDVLLFWGSESWSRAKSLRVHTTVTSRLANDFESTRTRRRLPRPSFRLALRRHLDPIGRRFHSDRLVGCSCAR